GDQESHIIATLNYNGDLTLLPKRYSINQDIWGYYNGISTSKSPFIQLPYYNTQGTLENGLNSDHFAFKNPSVSQQQFNTGRNWEADLGFASIGQLQSVEFETGGFISYEYDLHQYPEYPDNFFTQGGLRLKSY